MGSALALGLHGCKEDATSAADGGVHVQLGAIKTGRDKPKPVLEVEAAGETGGSTSATGSTGAPESEIDPVEICGGEETTLTKKEADATRSSPYETLGCAQETVPAGSAGSRQFWVDEALTQKLRDGGDDEHCCYDVVYLKKGRPLVTDAEETLADFELWGRDRSAPGAVHLGVAAAWLRDSRLEAASVASFLRARDELAAHGAPQALRAAYEEAADDERRHTRMCRRWAEHFAGRTIEVSIPPTPPPRRGNLLALLRRTFDEGCVAETIAAAAAMRSARGAAPAIAATLRRIADDETEHAALAWETIGWGLRRLDARDRETFVGWALARRPPDASAGVDPHARHGRLSRATERAIAAEIWRGCIEPTLRTLARTGPARPCLDATA